LKRQEIKDFRFLNHIVIWNIIVAIICVPTAGKLIDLLGTPLSISIYYFPFVYILSDIVTEVYGYALARRVLWYSIAAQLVAVTVFQLVELYPPSVVMTNNQSYVDVLSAAPRIVLFGTLAVFSGDIINNYVLAKMKVWTGGRYMPARFIVSTLCGQFANTAVFYTFALWGIMPPSLLIKSIALASLMKVGVEIALLPFAIRASVWLKKSEGVDVFDTATDFNPLKF
jgi:uncharacterized integral membrane protein (TIGR00697 family)